MSRIEFTQNRNDVRRQSLQNELDIMEKLVFANLIDEKSYNIQRGFILREMDALKARGNSPVSIEEVIKAYYSKNGYFDAIVTDVWPDGVVGMITKSPPYGQSVLEKLRGWSSNDYKKQVLGEWSTDQNDTPTVTTGMGELKFTNDLTDQEAESVLAQLKAAMEEQERLAYTGPRDANAAERLWREYNGIVLCECDNADCDQVVPMTHDEYIHASGHGGYYRVTSIGCSHGVLGAQLIKRGKYWMVWTKMP